ncbi:MAG TPA: hypothetical protein VKQ30_25905 [Ktedonobacterales bacterium]|nr:hypothetical protein [Ktedonobacterales bacterium]
MNEYDAKTTNTGEGSDLLGTRSLSRMHRIAIMAEQELMNAPTYRSTEVSDTEQDDSEEGAEYARWQDDGGQD